MPVRRALLFAAALGVARASGPGAAPFAASDCAASTPTAPLSRGCASFEAWAGHAPPKAACPCPGRSALAPTKTFYLNITNM